MAKKKFTRLGRKFASKKAMAEFGAIMEILSDVNPDALMADGFEDALIGFAERFGMEPVALYDHSKCISILVAQGMSEMEAEEYFSFNVIGTGGGSVPAFAIIARDVSGKK